jgi:hypothetical protein
MSPRASLRVEGSPPSLVWSSQERSSVRLRGPVFGVSASASGSDSGSDRAHRGERGATLREGDLPGGQMGLESDQAARADPIASHPPSSAPTGLRTRGGGGGRERWWPRVCEGRVRGKPHGSGRWPRPLVFSTRKLRRNVVGGVATGSRGSGGFSGRSVSGSTGPGTVTETGYGPRSRGRSRTRPPLNPHHESAATSWPGTDRGVLRLRTLACD